MCLLTRTKIPKFTTKPIVVYKRMVKVDDYILTPIVGKIYNFGRSYVAGIGKFSKMKLLKDFMKNKISAGFFHSYTTYSICKSNKNNWERVCKCVIPGFTFYYTNKEKTEIASRRIKFLNLEK